MRTIPLLITLGLFLAACAPPGPGPDLATRCPAQCARRTLKAEINGFLRIMRGSADLKSFKVHSGAGLTPPAGARWSIGHHLHSTVVYKARPLHPEHSDYWIVYFPGFRLKVRSTFEKSPEREAALERFLAQVGPAITEAATVEAKDRF